MSQRTVCPYARLFEPFVMNGPSGLRDGPRPFVFRAAHLNGTSHPAGAVFHFGMNLFDIDPAIIQPFIAAFSELARDGLGPGRKRVDLVEVMQSDPLALSLNRVDNEVSRLRVRFRTPTELKSGDELAAIPDFAVLACRVRDRISAFRLLYGEGPLSIDFQLFKERASAVKMTRCDINPVSSSRRSSRTGQVHPLGGFTGEAEYEGSLAEFVPYLTVARWTVVGRQTVWGKGEIATEILG